MIAGRSLTRAVLVGLLVAAPAVWFACSDNAPSSSTGPSLAAKTATGRPVAGLLTALAAQRRHTPALLEIPGVVGTAVTAMPDGGAGVLILAERSGISGLPQALDGVPVTVRVSGRLMAFSDPTRRQRPAPMGFSVGHPAITAGTIGARVRDALGRVYILSNNHVLANSNGANIGDPEYQPGPFDGGTAADQIATLTDFQVISFATNGSNTIDAAIALSSTAVLDNATPADDGYSMPNSTIYGDANGDGLFDDPSALLGLNVQKYGRTTRLTHGQITGVNATVTICYAVSGLTCTKTARYVDQLIISPGTFSGGGDSGSLIVTDDANLNPVALLFAGSSSVTIGNRIDLVLQRFGVTIDGFDPPPPGPFTDVAVTSVSGPSAAVQGSAGTITVTVKNVGNQDVSSFDVTLQDTTEHATAGTQTVAGLVAGASTTLTFTWTPTATGDHLLLARQTLADGRATNDQRATTISVDPPVTDIAVTNIGQSGTAIQGHAVVISVTLANAGNQSVQDGFAVALEDATDGVSLGTQTVNGLAVGATNTLTFTWDLTSASVGDHTLVATQARSDDQADNDRRTTVITVNPRPTDIALTGITAPARVTVGDIAHVLVTLKNVGEVVVGTSFDVALTDGWGGAPVSTQTVAAGLAVGSTVTVDIPWNTAGATTTTHTLFATQKLPDDVSTNNSAAIAILVQPPPDIAVTGVSAAADILQGATASVVVTVQNVGGQHVGGFNVVLNDQTAGVTIGTQAIPGLAVGYNTTATFNWSTTNAALGAHTLVATQTLSDANTTNDRGSTTVSVNPLSTDVAVSSVSAPASAARGSTVAIGVTIQNTGGQPVNTSFAVVLTDATAGATVGAQTITSLAGGASTTRWFYWNTGGATLGGHTLVASHSLTDQNATNNQRSVTVTLVSSPADIALANLTAPAQATVGDTVPVVVTVQNVGGQDVTSNFDVVVTDGGVSGPIVGTLTIGGLASGASATGTVNWNTAGATGGHTLIATQKFVDNNVSNNARAVGITVNPPSMHVGNLDGSRTIAADSWSATVQITVHDVRHNALSGVTVLGGWSGPGSGSSQCVTGEIGTCTVVLTSIPLTSSMVSFSVTGMTLTGAVYKPAGNHDPDGSSNGYSVWVKRF